MVGRIRTAPGAQNGLRRVLRSATSIIRSGRDSRIIQSDGNADVMAVNASTFPDNISTIQKKTSRKAREKALHLLSLRSSTRCFTTKSYESKTEQVSSNLSSNNRGSSSNTPSSTETHEISFPNAGLNDDVRLPASNKTRKKRAPLIIPDHITLIHEHGNTTTYECDICTKRFKTKAHTTYHKFCQDGEKSFKCDLCGRGFITKHHYEYHLRLHLGQRPYLCLHPGCGRCFNQQGKVTRHMRIAHWRKTIRLRTISETIYMFSSSKISFVNSYG